MPALTAPTTIKLPAVSENGPETVDVPADAVAAKIDMRLPDEFHIRTTGRMMTPLVIFKSKIRRPSLTVPPSKFW